MRSLAYYGVIVLLLVTESLTKPTCTKEKSLITDKMETDCTHLGLTAVPMTNIDDDTEVLILSYNSIKSLSTSVFKKLPQLVALDVSNNGMSTIQIDYPMSLKDLNLANNSFDQLPKLSQLKNLIKLDLSNNHIAAIPDTAFHGLHGLKELHLSGNGIKQLSEKVFKGLDQLDTLDLSFNQLTSVPPLLISDSVNLARIYLRGNSLTLIPDNFFDGLYDLAYVYLDLNPWTCNCNLKYFKEWVEFNEDNIYTITNGAPDKDASSVVCSNKVPLVNFFEKCPDKDDEDPDMPEPMSTNMMGTTRQVTTTAATTSRATTPVMTTRQTTTTPVMTTSQTTTTPVMTTSQTTTTPVMTTSQTTTTPVMTTKTETTSATTAPVTTKELTSTNQATPSISTEVSSPSTTIHTTKFITSISTALTPTCSPETVMVVNTTENQETKPGTTTTAQTMDIPLYTISNLPDLLSSMSKRRSWLEDIIDRYCCFLHLILYSGILLLLLLQIIVCLILLMWSCTYYHHYFQILREQVPNVRLTRYSLREPLADDKIFLVHGVNSTFRHRADQEPIPMLLLEAGTRDYSKSYTSAILT
ncbi:platelet glyco Ib alpha chain [Pelobates cultripes]|uniref:Platelet glyco Ib alpha chain n=1 Tax=Pelobates cultripes TaxID=61616 RepID=A0AAD1RJ78_PELCU|nr:platelet glyco Ib alpha chain [Pelobates cultripes]